MMIRAANVLSVMALAAMLGACDSSAPEAAPGIAADVQTDTPDAGKGHCLDAVWTALEERGNAASADDKAYDEAHDAVPGGTISCATATSASQFAAVLEAIRASASTGDAVTLLAETGIPLVYIDGEGNEEAFELAEAKEAAFQTVFTDETLERLANATVDDLTVVPNEGAYLDLGALWLVVPETGARPQLVTVNAQAAREAKAAREARR